ATTFGVGGQVFQRIRYESEQGDWGANRQPYHDWAVAKGALHIFGCDVERCPRFGPGALLRLSILRSLDRRMASENVGQSLNLSDALNHDAHSVGLNHGHCSLRRNAFAFGENIDNMIGKTRLAARSQNRDCGALHSRCERERSRELSRYACE